jgi:hypothetical protein
MCVLRIIIIYVQLSTIINLKLFIMKIQTRVSAVLQMDYPKSWEDKLINQNPNNRLYITVEKPASDMSIEDLESLIENKKTKVLVKEAQRQLNEVMYVIRSLGCQVDVKVTGDLSHLFKEDELPF